MTSFSSNRTSELIESRLSLALAAFTALGVAYMGFLHGPARLVFILLSGLYLGCALHSRLAARLQEHRPHLHHIRLLSISLCVLTMGIAFRLLSRGLQPLWCDLSWLATGFACLGIFLFLNRPSPNP